MTWLWPIPTIVLLAAVAMLWFGLRGRRVDDHPICRRCGFDLFGRPDGSLRCSECGAELVLRRAIVQGRRVRRRWMIAVGALLLAIVVTVGGGVGYAMYAISDLQPHKPLWWLISEMNGSDATARNAAVAELSRRLAAGQLAPSQSDAAVDAMLDIQADARQSPPRRPFTVAMGNFVEDVRQAGALSRDRAVRFARQAPVLRYTVVSHPSERQPRTRLFVIARFAAGNQTKIAVHVKGLKCVLDGVTCEARPMPAFPLLSRGMPSGWFEILVPPDARVAMAPGSSHRLVAEARLEVVEPRVEARLDGGQDVTIAHDEVFTVLR